MWWLDIIIVLVLIFGVYGFLTLVGFRGRWFSRRTERTAESMYENYADSTRQQRRYAKQRGQTWRDQAGPDGPAG